MGGVVLPAKKTVRSRVTFLGVVTRSYLYPPPATPPTGQVIAFTILLTFQGSTAPTTFHIASVASRMNRVTVPRWGMMSAPTVAAALPPPARTSVTNAALGMTVVEELLIAGVVPRELALMGYVNIKLVLDRLVSMLTEIYLMSVSMLSIAVLMLVRVTMVGAVGRRMLVPSVGLLRALIIGTVFGLRTSPITMHTARQTR